MWLTILLAIIEAIVELLPLLQQVAKIDDMPENHRKMLARAFKKMDQCRSEGIRIGMPFTSSEVQNAQ